MSQNAKNKTKQKNLNANLRLEKLASTYIFASFQLKLNINGSKTPTTFSHFLHK